MAIWVAILAGCASAPVATLPDGSPIYAASFTPDPDDPSVTLNCLVMEGGYLSDCRLVEETPTASGFAQAALDAVEAAKPRLDISRSPESVGQRVTFTSRFSDKP